MKDRLFGFIIRRERVCRGWSQEGLCRGICAVSYLSKIEQGKAAPTEEILRLLFRRLELPWIEAKQWEELVQTCYDALYSGALFWREDLQKKVEEAKEAAAYSVYAPDLALLYGLLQTPGQPADEAYEPYFDRRRLALQRSLQGRHEEALCLDPSPLLYFRSAMSGYSSGENYARVMEHLQKCYDLAAAEGYVDLMLESSMTMGSCYSNQRDLANMEAHYRVAERLARALGRETYLQTIAYNRAATQIEVGDYAGAYMYFHGLTEHTAMSLHKLAICCEKLGKRGEAFSALDRAETEVESPDYVDADLARLMCRLVRMRLENPDYLQDPLYGERLMDCFARCRAELPIGYAVFHLPWVLEWLKASRQYKKAYELIESFPVKTK